MSTTLKKLGIEFKEISQNQIDDAVASIQSMRLEQILIADNEIFDWQNLLQRPDLISIKYPEKLGTLFQEQETAANYSLFLFSSDSPFRKNVIRFVASKNYRYVQLIIVAISLIPFCIEASKIAFLIEVASNSLFGVDIIVKSIACGFVLHKSSYMRNIWNFINFLAFMFGWCIFLEDSVYKQILQSIRLLRVFRFIQEVSFLKIQFTAYVSSFLRLRSVLIPIFLVMIYFAVVGLHLFRGLTEFRCRLTPEPEDGLWEADDSWKELCGIRQCPVGTFCGNPIYHGLPKNMTENDEEDFFWDFIRFDDFFHSLFVVFTFLNVTGWSGTTFMFWKAMTTYVTATYFLVLIVLLAFILSNLLLALFYESFMEKSSIKNSQKKAKEEQEYIENEIKKKHQQQLMNRLTIMSRQPGMPINPNPQFSIYFPIESLKQKGDQKLELFDRISNSKKFIALNDINIILSAVVIALDYHNISKSLLEILFIIDFCCIIYSLWEILLQLSGKGLKQYFSNYIQIFDFLIILSQFILIFVLLILAQPIIINHNKYVILMKSFKILRVFRFLYFAQVFYTISILTKALISTLIKLKNIILLWGCLFFFIAVLGKSLLQHKMEEEEKTINYDDFGSALMASLNIFFNEEWHITMYKYARNTSISFIFYILSVILGQVFFIRLMTAIFLSEFEHQLKSIQSSLKPYDFSKIILYILSICKPKKKEVMKESQKLGKKTKKTTENENVELNSNNNDNRYFKKAIKSNSILNSIQHQHASLREIDEFQNWLQMESAPQQQSCQASGKQIPNNRSSISLPQSQSDNASSLNKTFFLFSESNIIRVKVKKLIENLPFRIFLLLIVLASAIRIALFTPFLDPKSDTHSILEIVRFICTILFSLQIVLNIIANGLYKGPESYLQQSPYNILNFVITLTDIIAQFYESKQLLFNLISNLRILEFIRIGAELNQSINYISQALIKAFQTMIQLSIFCFIILLVYGTFSTKLLKGELYYCVNYGEHKIEDKWECMDYGGSWINKILGYDNIFDSILTLFVTATTEAWVPLLVDAWSARGVDLMPENNYNRWWIIYFQVFFFIGNICMLNMFISLVVESYKETKIKAQGMSDLNANQREWLSIKQNIAHLKPHVMHKPPSNKIALFLYYFVESKYTGYFWHSVIAINSIILSLFYTRQDSTFEDILSRTNFICILIFTVEAFSRLIVKIRRIKQKDVFLIVDFFGVSINLIDQFFVKNIENDFQLVRSFGALSVAFQLLRNYYIVRRFPELERLFYSVFTLIPSALAMIFIMFIFLFIYTVLGIDLFGYLRAQPSIDGFDLHFRKFTTAMFSLIKVASSEFWWALLVDAAHLRTPDFACIYIDTYEQFQEHGFNGCGTSWAYVYFISFHLIFSLVILNLFIASILGAYEEHVKQEQSAISKYQLHDVLNYWAQYDPEGTGFLNYKQFWKLSSEIAICFGVSVKDLLDPENKKKFLQALNVSLYENQSGLMGYLFHDVILSLTRISVELKYGVKDLEYGGERGEDNQHDYYKAFKYTPYNSGQMSAIIYLQGKVRTLMNKRRGINFLNLAALRQELQNQNEIDKYGN